MIRTEIHSMGIEIFRRIILLVVISALVVAAVGIGRRTYKGDLQEGDIADETVYAPFTFTVKGDIDRQTTDRLREEAANAVLDIYVLNEKINSDVLSQVDTFFDKLKQVGNLEGIEEEQKVGMLADAFPEVNRDDLGAWLKEKDSTVLFAGIKEIAAAYLDSGLISSENKNLLLTSQKDKISLKAAQKENIVETRLLNDLDQCKKNIERDLKEKVKANLPTEAAVCRLVNSKLTENIFYDEKETLLRKQKARKAVTPVYEKITILKDEIIIAKNQRVTKEQISYLQELINRLGEEQKHANRFSFIAGLSILSMAFFSIEMIYFRLHRRKFFSNFKNLVLIAVLTLFIILVSKFVVFSAAPSYLIPVASVAMCLTILIDYEIATVATVILSLLVGIISGNKLSVTIVSVIGGIVGIYGVKQVRRRSQILSAGLLVGAANFICITAIGLLQNLTHDVFLTDGLWGVANGIFSSFIVMGILPVLEYSFKITTNVSLLELSDLNHPLLKEMILSAPGTYHHSLIVGNLAEAAADAVGANSMLARVASYYHDIGKMKNADYFAENKIEAEGRHLKLQPKMSNLIITNHVKEGVELAEKYKLSLPIIDIIKQHHGTSLTFYFYQKALEEQDETVVEEEEFRYQGPKPQTKEAAIVLLADSVEAASRTIPEPTATKIEKLVHRIINNKFIDGQLEECDLTLKDLHKIADSFTRILVGIYHSRVDYPQPEGEETESGETEKTA